MGSAVQERVGRLAGMPAHEMVILSFLPLDIFVCGVCPYDAENLAVMAYEEPQPSEVCFFRLTHRALPKISVRWLIPICGGGTGLGVAGGATGTSHHQPPSNGGLV